MARVESGCNFLRFGLKVKLFNYLPWRVKQTLLIVSAAAEFEDLSLNYTSSPKNYSAISSYTPSLLDWLSFTCCNNVSRRGGVFIRVVEWMSWRREGEAAVQVTAPLLLYLLLCSVILTTRAGHREIQGLYGIPPQPPMNKQYLWVQIRVDKSLTKVTKE